MRIPGVRRYPCVVLSALMLQLAATVSTGVPAAEAATFTRADGVIVLDGRLDEAAWRRAVPVTRFFEVYPANVRVPATRTDVRLLHDERNIYVGIHAFDPNASAIRSSLGRRDESLEAQDYVEILLDPSNARQNAWLFRTNPHGVQADGRYDEATRTRDFAPDFDFDVRSSIDAAGWSAEFRIPLSSLRQREGATRPWAFAVYRNWPRFVTTTLASAPVPRAATCLLCFAGEASGIRVEPRGDAYSATPHVTFARAERSVGARGGIDLKWQPRTDTAVDLTVRPDFSQVEADSPQLTANTRFALALTEKRPFFQEGADLFASPIPVVYTRSFTQPDAGVRVTARGGGHEYSALLLRDTGGGLVIEPGATSSATALQDFQSDAFVGRYARTGPGASWGGLVSARVNEDHSRNLVVGVDADWRPTTSDQISAQLLHSDTSNPSRPDLLPAWAGQRLNGNAAALDWTHLADSWYGILNARLLSRGFRAWNGFVTQVGISSVSASSGLTFYPGDSVLTRISPQVTLAHTQTTDGLRVSRRVAPGISFQAARDTLVTLTWSPNEEGMTDAGLRTFDSLSASISSTPLAWTPGASLTIATGDALDLATGDVREGRTVKAVLPVRLQRLDLRTTLGYQSLDDRFTERTASVNGVWHFSGQLYAQAIHQSSRLTSDDVLDTSELSSLLLSYQRNWQTRYFVGFRQSDGLTREREIFAKLSYVFSR
jgi:hypothetical protein